MDPRNIKDEMNAENGLEQELDSIRAQLSAHGDQEPPALLDQAVLNTARRELAGRRRRQVRWIGAFATVSVLVLTLTLVVQQSQVPVAPATGKTNGIRLGPVNKREAAQQEKDRMDTAGQPDRAAGEPVVREEVRQLNARAERAAPAISKAESDFDLGNESLASPSPPSSASMQQSSENSGDVERIQPDSVHDTPATSVPTGERVTEGKQQESMAGQSRRSVDERRVEVTDTMPGSEPDEQVIEAQAKEYELNSNLEDPDHWIARLLALRQNRQFERLQLELDAFQAAYPDYPLPPELADPDDR